MYTPTAFLVGLFICYSKLFLLEGSSSGGAQSMYLLDYKKDRKGLFFAFLASNTTLFFPGEYLGIHLALPFITCISNFDHIYIYIYIYIYMNQL